MSDESAPQQMLEALRTRGTPDHLRALELLRSDTPARQKLVALAQHENARARDATDAVAALTNEPQPGLRTFYKDRLGVISAKSSTSPDEVTQAIDLARALGVVADKSEIAPVGAALSWLTANGRAELNDWSFGRLAVAGIAVGEKGGTANRKDLDAVRRFALDHARARKSANNALDYQEAALVFAAEYSQRVSSGKSSSAALTEIYGTSDEYLVRVAAMNGLRVLGAVPNERLLEAFPFRSDWERDRWLEHVFRWSLQIASDGLGKVPPQSITLADGSHPSGPLTGDALERAITDMRAKLKRESSWPTPLARSITSTAPLAPHLVEKTLLPSELIRDRRLERPVIGGIQ